MYNLLVTVVIIIYNSHNFSNVMIIELLRNFSFDNGWIAIVFMGITLFILLPEKFLPFDWLRAEVFQLNLKYLHVRITVTMVTQNHQINSSHELRKNGGEISRFWNQVIQDVKKIWKTKILRKVHRPGSMSGPAGPKTRASKPVCSPTKRNNSTKINTWR